MRAPLCSPRLIPRASRTGEQFATDPQCFAERAAVADHVRQAAGAKVPGRACRRRRRSAATAMPACRARRGLEGPACVKADCTASSRELRVAPDLPRITVRNSAPRRMSSSKPPPACGNPNTTWEVGSGGTAVRVSFHTLPKTSTVASHTRGARKAAASGRRSWATLSTTRSNPSPGSIDSRSRIGIVCRVAATER